MKTNYQLGFFDVAKKEINYELDITHNHKPVAGFYGETLEEIFHMINKYFLKQIEKYPPINQLQVIWTELPENSSYKLAEFYPLVDLLEDKKLNETN